SVTAVAALATAKGAASGLLQPVFGAMVDRSKRTWLLPVSVVRCGALTALLGVLPSYWMLLAAALWAGLAGAVFHPLATVSVSAMAAGYLSDRWGRKPVVVLSTLLATPALLAFLATDGPWQA